MSVLRRWLPNLLLSGASLLACLLALEGWARLTVWRWARLPNPLRAPLAQPDPLLGWSKPPGAAGWLVRPEYQVHLKINSLGLRGPERGYGKPPGTRRVLLLGDSFTEGYTVPEEQTVRARLEELLDCGPQEVLNAGTAAWGTDQELLFWRHQGWRHAPDVVSLLFYYNDLYGDRFGDDVGPPHFELAGPGDRLVLRGSPMPPPRRPLASRAFRMIPWRGSMALRLLSLRTGTTPRLHARLAAVGLVEPRPAPATELPEELYPFGPWKPGEVARNWRRFEALLHELEREVRAHGARLVVFYVPARFEIDDRAWEATRRQYGLGHRRWSRDKVFDELGRVCARLGLPLVDPRAGLRSAEAEGRTTYFPLDGHWTRHGHAAAAEALRAELGRLRLDGCNGAMRRAAN